MRILGHAVRRAHLQDCSAVLFHQAAQVSVRQKSGQAAVWFEHGGHAQLLRGHFVKHVRHGRVFRNARQRFSRMHQVLHAKQLLAQAPSGMQRRKIIVPKIEPLEEGNRQRIAHRHGHRRACRGRQIQRAGLFLHAHVQSHVARLGERRVNFSCQRH